MSVEETSSPCSYTGGTMTAAKSMVALHFADEAGVALPVIAKAVVFAHHHGDGAHGFDQRGEVFARVFAGHVQSEMAHQRVVCAEAGEFCAALLQRTQLRRGALRAQHGEGMAVEGADHAVRAHVGVGDVVGAADERRVADVYAVERAQRQHGGFARIFPFAVNDLQGRAGLLCCIRAVQSGK